MKIVLFSSVVNVLVVPNGLPLAYAGLSFLNVPAISGTSSADGLGFIFR